ncbi:MAG TPA: glycosyltransferase family 9 protein [Lysobacter sp.]
MLREDMPPLASDPTACMTGPAPGPRPSILVIRQGAFGDLVQADGALRDIRAHHPDAHVSLLVAPQFRRLMERCPHVDELIVDPRASWLRVDRNLELLRRLRERGFAHVYDLQGSQRTRLYRRLLPPGLPWHRKDNGGASGVPDRTAYARLLAQAGVAAAHADAPDVSWMADDVSALLAASGIGPGYVVLIPGSSAQHVHKRWPGYAQLAQRLIDGGRQVVVAPGPDELQLARTLPCEVLLGPTGFLDWFALAGVLARAAFVVGNDTGPTHLAACLGTPGLALFGAHTSAQRTGIRMRAFDAIEVADLQRLSVDDVVARVAPDLIRGHPG